MTVRLPAVIAAPASMAPGSHEVMMADGGPTKVSRVARSPAAAGFPPIVFCFISSILTPHSRFPLSCDRSQTCRVLSYGNVDFHKASLKAMVRAFFVDTRNLQIRCGSGAFLTLTFLVRFESFDVLQGGCFQHVFAIIFLARFKEKF